MKTSRTERGEISFNLAPTPRVAPQLLTVDDVVDALHVSRAHVFRLLASGTLKSVRTGRCRRIRPADLERFIDTLADDASA